MMGQSLGDAVFDPALVLHHWIPDHPRVSSVTAVSGGFSGARVYRVEHPDGPFALRCWPTESVPWLRVVQLHQFLEYLKFRGVPVAVPLPDRTSGRTYVLETIEIWQLEPWLPGSPAAGDTISQAQLADVMESLANMHLAAAEYKSCNWFACEFGTPPAICERLRHIEFWRVQTLAKINPQLRSRIAPAALELVSEVVDLFHKRATAVASELKVFEGETCPLHPCFRDLWSAHVLFDGNRVSGFIDPAAARTEHVASDLSRLLGSYFGDDRARWEQALEIYSRTRPLSELDRRLIRVYDRSSVLLSGLNWVERLLAGSVPPDQESAVAKRLERIVGRMRVL